MDNNLNKDNDKNKEQEEQQQQQNYVPKHKPVKENPISIKLLIIIAIVGIVLLALIYIVGQKNIAKEQDLNHIVEDTRKEVEKEKQNKFEEMERELGQYMPKMNELDEIGTFDEDSESYLGGDKTEVVMNKFKVNEDEAKNILELRGKNALISNKDNIKEERLKLNFQKNYIHFKNKLKEYEGIGEEEYYKRIKKEDYILNQPVSIWSLERKYHYPHGTFISKNVGYKRDESNENIYYGYPIINESSSGETLVYVDYVLVEDMKYTDFEKVLKNNSPVVDGVISSFKLDSHKDEVVDNDDYFNHCLDSGYLIHPLCYSAMGEKADKEYKLFESRAMENEEKYTITRNKFDSVIPIDINKGKIVSGGSNYHVVYYLDEDFSDEEELTMSIGSMKFKMIPTTDDLDVIEKHFEW